MAFPKFSNTPSNFINLNTWECRVGIDLYQDRFRASCILSEKFSNYHNMFGDKETNPNTSNTLYKTACGHQKDLSKWLSECLSKKKNSEVSTKFLANSKKDSTQQPKNLLISCTLPQEEVWHSQRVDISHSFDEAKVLEELLGVNYHTNWETGFLSRNSSRNTQTNRENSPFRSLIPKSLLLLAGFFKDTQAKHDTKEQIQFVGVKKHYLNNLKNSFTEIINNKGSNNLSLSTNWNFLFRVAKKISKNEELFLFIFERENSLEVFFLESKLESKREGSSKTKSHETILYEALFSKSYVSVEEIMYDLIKQLSLKPDAKTQVILSLNSNAVSKFLDILDAQNSFANTYQVLNLEDYLFKRLGISDSQFEDYDPSLKKPHLWNKSILTALI